MKVAQLLNQNFLNSVALLRTIRPESLAASVKIKKIYKRIEEELKIFEEARRETLEDLADKDEEGKAIINGNGDYQLSRENQMKMADKLSEIASMEIEIGVIHLSELGDLSQIKGLSALDLENLESILIVD